MNEAGGREKFFKVYASVPLGARNEIILSMPGVGPITWTVAYIEISNSTEKGDKILTKLKELRII